MGSVYFITTAYPGIAGYGGGALIRKGEVEILRQNGFDTWVIIPDKSIKQSIIDNEEKIIRIAFKQKKHLLKVIMQKAGVIEDAGIDWINNVVEYLQNHIKTSDIVFCVTGGGLDTVIAGSKLKKISQCKFLVNFHDPVINSHVYGKKIRLKSSTFFHVNRDQVEKKYLHNVDCIITSSASYEAAILDKYPQLLQGKTQTFHFGYIKNFQPQTEKRKTFFFPIKIGYGGNMGMEQSPEILAKVVSRMDDVQAYFLGDIQNNKYLRKPIRNVHCIDSLNHEQYLAYMYQNIDIAFLSLDGDLSALCVPSKLYEYINLGIPIIAVVKGDACKIVIENGIGIVCDYDEIAIRDAIIQMKDPQVYKKYFDAIAIHKEHWSMKMQSVKMIEKIKQIALKPTN